MASKPQRRQERRGKGESMVTGGAKNPRERKRSTFLLLSLFLHFVNRVRGILLTLGSVVDLNRVDRQDSIVRSRACRLAAIHIPPVTASSSFSRLVIAS